MQEGEGSPFTNPVSYTAIGRHIYKRLKMCKQYAKEMATLQ